jgi:putative NADPH-quinone reductase
MSGTMSISVILVHPREGSFNHAIAGVVADTLCESGHKVIFHDLYAERFGSELPYAGIVRDARF